jgi:hypothetical protein
MKLGKYRRSLRYDKKKTPQVSQYGYVHDARPVGSGVVLLECSSSTAVTTQATGIFTDAPLTCLSCIGEVERSFAKLDELIRRGREDGPDKFGATYYERNRNF